MTAPSANPAPRQDNSTGKLHDTKTELSQEQVKAIVDLVYAMLLSDLRQERERNRIMIWNSRTCKRG